MEANLINSFPIFELFLGSDVLIFDWFWWRMNIFHWSLNLFCFLVGAINTIYSWSFKIENIVSGIVLCCCHIVKNSNVNQMSSFSNQKSLISDDWVLGMQSIPIGGVGRKLIVIWLRALCQLDSLIVTVSVNCKLWLGWRLLFLVGCFFFLVLTHANRFHLSGYDNFARDFVAPTVIATSTSVNEWKLTGFNDIVVRW